MYPGVQRWKLIRKCFLWSAFKKSQQSKKELKEAAKAKAKKAEEGEGGGEEEAVVGDKEDGGEVMEGDGEGVGEEEEVVEAETWASREGASSLVHQRWASALCREAEVCIV